MNPPNAGSGALSARIASLDIIRGAVMVLMAIDHVRVFSGLPAGGATAGIFFTRWVTHFCAPAVVVSLVRLGAVSPWLFANHPMGNPPAPEGYTWSLALLYLVFAIAVVVLYPACRWFGALRTRRSDWWLRYL